MNKYAMIGTWRMALEGLEAATTLLSEEASVLDGIETAIRTTESLEKYTSVGKGGYPNIEGVLEMDAAFMDGVTLQSGGVFAIQDIAHPISVARHLSTQTVNTFLSGVGARTFALNAGFSSETMLTELALNAYEKRKAETLDRGLSAYSGHDTIGVVGVKHGACAAGTSTSGLFMKHPGRIGDSAILGSGLYASAQGAATATGLGEDIMKGIVSYEIVRRIEAGESPQSACETVVFELDRKLTRIKGSAGDISVVALNDQGEWGAASNIQSFSFVVCTESLAPTVFQTTRVGDHMVHREADTAWIEAGIFD